jgi:hypothetical protein
MSVKPLLVAALALVPSTSFALSTFRSEVPNGIVGSCLTCHERATGAAPWNAFGDLLFTTNGGTPDQARTVDALSPSFIWWNAEICNADPDGDGQTNGQELGDPECVWTGGAAARSSDISRPGDASSVSADPDGVGGGGGGGEGGGDGPAPGCFGSLQTAALLPALLLLRLRRRRR